MQGPPDSRCPARPPPKAPKAASCVATSASLKAFGRPAATSHASKKMARKPGTFILRCLKSSHENNGKPVDAPRAHFWH
eukprot:13564120-Alexandrium_andersonii.AAC.1